ncbi:UNC-like C-terminal-domain-containing protein, partial [Bombardia bombarda]
MRRPPQTSLRPALALALLGLHAVAVCASKAGQLPPPVASPAEVCEYKTINYITHTLPQLCLRTAWSSPTPVATPPQASDSGNATSATTAPPSPKATVHETKQEQQPDDRRGEATAAPSASAVPNKQEKEQERHEEPASEELATSSFMSFEEWKEMMLRKSGQDPADFKSRKQREHRGERDVGGIAHADLDSLGDDGEIALDFDALSEKVSELTSSSSGETASQAGGGTAKEEQVFYDDGKTQYYRSKDAGKTCKERFSYSSFDAGATVLKTNKGAKNAKAILVENKDSYMLLECRAKNKFVIVELSDDILVDTVVLANFEFFSSMIRTFRVSVSDRYPVKMDKWVDLGTFEARNSRDIQPFLVEHPQIYTKYIRIEFLSHYGNEYYCPVSLLRVHGTRMLDSWKESDSNQDDDAEQIDAPPAAQKEEPVPEVPEAQQPPAEYVMPSNATEKNTPNVQDVTEVGLTPWHPVFQYDFSLETCALRSPTTGEPTPVSSDTKRHFSNQAGRSDTTAQSSSASIAHETARSAVSSSSSISASPEASSAHSRPTGASSSSASSVVSPSTQAGHNSSASSSSQKPSTARANSAGGGSGGADAPPSGAPSVKTTASASTTTTTASRNKTSAASSAASAPPTVQESFFKTVTKRLQHLESNTSLSLQYIEEQSRFLQEVLMTMEKKQISRVDTFLDCLNKTVLSELRNVRTQYDQIWQSTVIALETQREQSQREIVALSGRLTVLADEVVFQKRMAILQSILLLSCLVLVIFSRGLIGPSSIDLGLSNNNSNNSGRRHARFASPPPPSSMMSPTSMMETPMSPSPSPSPSPSSTIKKHNNNNSINNNNIDNNQYPLSPSPFQPASVAAIAQHNGVSTIQHLHSSRLYSRSNNSSDKALPLTPPTSTAASSISDFRAGSTTATTSTASSSRESSATPIIRIDGVDVPFF